MSRYAAGTTKRGGHGVGDIPSTPRGSEGRINPKGDFYTSGLGSGEDAHRSDGWSVLFSKT